MEAAHANDIDLEGKSDTASCCQNLKAWMCTLLVQRPWTALWSYHLQPCAVRLQLMQCAMHTIMCCAVYCTHTLGRACRSM